MKLKLRIISAAAAGIVTFTSLGLHLFAADDSYTLSQEDSRYKYTFVNESEKTISILANGQLSGNVKIPAELDGNTVVQIEEFGFSEQAELTGITIPDSVTTISSFAFNNCSALKTASVPDSITNMGIRPFMLTPFETELEKKSSSDFVLINDYILYKYKGSDADIVIPNGVKVISNSVFAYDENSENTINSIVFPDSVEYICDYAFWDCSGISSITLGSGIKSISATAFTCTNMTVTGYILTYAEKYAQQSNYEFVPILDYGETRAEVVYTDKLRQYYFSDEDSFSKDGIKVYKRNHDGTLEDMEWSFSATPKSLYEGK